MDTEATVKSEANSHKHILHRVCIALLCVVSTVITFMIIVVILLGSGTAETGITSPHTNYEFLNRFDSFINNSISSALDGLVEIQKVYYLSDSDPVAPVPDPEKYGEVSDPASMQDILTRADQLLNGQSTIFTTQTSILENSSIRYYLDYTTFVVTWKQPIDGTVYTLSEVKIAHPSQFRRFLSDGKFGSEKQYLTSQMASSVNAVVASSGDFYKYRAVGTVVYNGIVERFSGTDLDTCFIDENGNLIFSPAGELTNFASTQKFVDENKIRFSLSFGPILIEDGERVEPRFYIIGEINDKYPRAALCQIDELHYLLVTANTEDRYQQLPNLHDFAQILLNMGVDKAYTIDGGQTATIVMNNEIINRINYDSERAISDIIYFATAIPNSD